MNRLFPILVGLRYSWSSNRPWFVSFFVMVSIIGISLGVAVLISVLSVMNGFRAEIEKHIFSDAPHIIVSHYSLTDERLQQLQQTIAKEPQIIGSAPYILEQGLLKVEDDMVPVFLQGIEPNAQQSVSDIGNKMLLGDLEALLQGKFNIIISEQLASRLRVSLGDKVTVITAKVSTGIIGPMPMYKRFSVAGIFRTDKGIGLNNNYAYMHLSDAAKLLKISHQPTGVRLAVDDLYAAPVVAKKIAKELAYEFAVMDWTRQYGSHMKVVQLEKLMMTIVLSLLVLIATFNLVSSLVMIVNEKQADIAVLRTFGATPWMIKVIFVVQGSAIGAFGTLLGTTFGLLLAYNISYITNAILSSLGMPGLLASVYGVDHFPSVVSYMDVLLVVCISVTLSLLATLYPAIKAAKLNPVEALRHA